jgi:hypothetical protein
VFTHNGITVTNRVFLEPPVLAAFLDYLRREGLWLPAEGT